MSRWTDAAKTKLEQYFAALRGSLAASGVDADEVTEDLRRHIEEEVAARRLSVVTEEDAGQILARIGSPEGIKPAAEPVPAPVPAADERPGKKGKPPGGGLLFFGVLLPMGAIAFEFFSGACAGMFFNPLPTLWHVLLVALVPAANLLAWLDLRRGESRRLTLLSWANGAALGIALAFAVAFLPLTPYAVASVALVVGVLFYGIGLAPLAPALAFVSSLLLGRQLRAARGNPAARYPFWGGFGIGLTALVLFTLPMALTEVGLQMAASDDPGESTRGVRLLRVAGKDEILLRACYGRSGRAGDLYCWGKPISPETARFVYYRVHGQPFNAVPPPKLYAGRARWDLMEQEFTWDQDQAGDSVAGRVRGLGLVHSRQDAVIEPDAALAYLEWTLEFKNDSPLQRESRAQIVLPPGGVVSRLTLWIDGEEREAAFGGRSQVKAAYKAVVRQRRDPVLVTTCGPDRILMRCYPVPPNGGRMKVRLGITAPLVLSAKDRGNLRWPVFAERNFSLGGKFQHSIWAESSMPLESNGAARLRPETGKSGRFALRGQLADAELSAPAHTVRAHRSPEVKYSWTRNTRQPDGPIIQQTIAEQTVEAPDRVIVVVDGSKGMETFYRSIKGALTRLPANIDFALLLARDGCEDLVPLQKGTADLYGRIALWKFSSPGGHDNVPALLRAWELAAAAKAGVIIWIHGPQPVVLESVEDLRQRFERSTNPPRLYDVETKVGPDRILEKLDGFSSVQSIVRLGDLGDDLGRLFGPWNGSSALLTLTRQVVPEGIAADLPGKEASLHLARLWAAAEVNRLSKARQLETAAGLAARQQLVTPISGAVVLETRAQYESAGLQPVAAQSVPTVPEPSSGALLLLFLLLLAWGRRRGLRNSGTVSASNNS